MTTSRLYVFQHPGTTPIPESGHAAVWDVLKAAQRHCWWYEQAEVQGEPYGRLSINVVVHGRDQWWCHQRALKLATDCYYAMGLTEKDVPEPLWEPLAPHTNRGHHRVIR
jgi:hypothetical protein